MNKQISLVQSVNGWIIQVMDPSKMMTGDHLQNYVARNVDEAMNIVREQLTGTSERQPVPQIFNLADMFTFELPPGVAPGEKGQPE